MLFREAGLKAFAAMRVNDKQLMYPEHLQQNWPAA
jgi:hypothetical protein